MNVVGAILKGLVYAATFAVMFGGALRLGLATLLRVREEPALFARVFLAIWIAVPALTILVDLAMNLPPLSSTILVLMAVCPGIPVLLASTRSVRGAMPTAFVAIVLTAATEPLLIPFWTRLLGAIHPADLTVRPSHVLAVLLPTVFLPVTLGFAIRALSLRAATVLAGVSDKVYLVGLIVGGAGALWQGVPLLPAVPVRTFVAVVLITIGDAVIGYWAGRPKREDQKAVALASALGNPALALAVVEVSYPGHQAGAMVAAYLLCRALALAPFEWWLRRLRDDDGRSPPAAPVNQERLAFARRGRVLH